MFVLLSLVVSMCVWWFSIVLIQCFLLHLINSAEVEVTTKSISPSMMKVFQRGLLSQKYFSQVITWRLYFRFFLSMKHMMVDLHFYRDNDGSRLTESGFQFLVWKILNMYLHIFILCIILLNFDVCLFALQLMDTNAQLWYIIREYISNSEVFFNFWYI